MEPNPEVANEQTKSPPRQPPSISVSKNDLSNFVEKMEEESKEYLAKRPTLGLQNIGPGEEVAGEDKNWYELRLQGKYPERRGYHSTFSYNRKMFIYGGHDIREGSLSSLWMLDFSRLSDLDKSED